MPGGSSGGSAAAVAANLCAASLGTDTGGSIRQPAALCGVVGVKPTYGRVSRYGSIAYASSLDQVGPLARTVEDAALVLEVIAGHDARDATSLAEPSISRCAGRRRQAAPPWPASASACRRSTSAASSTRKIRTAARCVAVAALRDAGAVTVEVSLPHTHLAIPAYYLIAPAEASSNLARYDGVRYGTRAEAKGLLELYTRTRGLGLRRRGQAPHPARHLRTAQHRLLRARSTRRRSRCAR